MVEENQILKHRRRSRPRTRSRTATGTSVWSSRIARVRALLPANSIHGLLVTDPVNLGYLFNARDARWGLIASNLSVVMPVPLGWETMCQEAGSHCRVLAPEKPALTLASLLRRRQVRRLGVESSSLSVTAHRSLARDVAESGLLVPTEGIVEKLRERKDCSEVALLRRAGEITGDIARRLKWIIRAGMSEREVVSEIDVRMLAAGADGPAFETIVLFGKRSSLPHGASTGARARRGDLVLVDFGARVNGYRSDATRVLTMGVSSARQRIIYSEVRQAYAAGRRAAGAGRSGAFVDGAARRALGGRAARFIHGLGHGVGLEIHEAPRLAAGSEVIIKAGHVVTVEPGVYFPGWGGIRLEDTFLIEARGNVKSLTGEPDERIPIVEGER